MTVIAWDGKQLAGDRLGDHGGTAVTVRKVFRSKFKGRNLLLGISGELARGMAWVRWMQGEGPEPKMDKDVEFAALIIDERRRIWKVEWPLVHVRYRDRIAALGSGRDAALAAMAMGADARRAVQIASRFDTGSGRGVDVVRF